MSFLHKVDTDPAEATTLVLSLGDHDRTNFPGSTHVGPPVGLSIEPNDVDHPNLIDELGKEVDLCPNQRGVLVCRIARKERNLNGPLLRKLRIQVGLDQRQVIGGPVRDVEVEPTSTWFHVSSGNRALESPPYDTAQRMHGRVGAHEAVSTCPIEYTGHTCPHRRHPALKPVPHTIGIARHPHHSESVIADRQFTEVVRLAPSARVEDGSIQQHAIVISVGPHNRRIHNLRVGIGRIDLFGHTHTIDATICRNEEKAR